MIHYLESLEVNAIDAVLADWKMVFPDGGILALLPEAEEASVPALQAACSASGLSLAGGIVPALIVDGEFRTDGAWLLGFGRMPPCALHEDLPTDQGGAERLVDGIAEELRESLREESEKTLFLLFDAMVPNVGTYLDHLYLRLANRVRYSGSNVGSETFLPRACLFDNERFVRNGLLIMLLDNRFGANLEHGYRVSDRTVYATAAKGNRIDQIEWRPAFDVYKEMVRDRFGTEITAENFYRYAVHFPFGILRANHHAVVRIPVSLSEDESLVCVGEIPENSLLALLEAPAADSEETVDRLEEGVLCGGAPESDQLMFYCAGRRMHFGSGAAESEIRRYADRFPSGRIAGALSLGEIGGSTIHGYPLFHNACISSMIWDAE
ncbi:MAG: histidine kinase [Treponema sp. GWB1_62_6]|nr:MAG: histidine kinase [Treponema sp. GWC1_61_84]OHE67972.1 MAG: histidine kinase [Treponema sp. GWB1_62_6]